MTRGSSNFFNYRRLAYLPPTPPLTPTKIIVRRLHPNMDFQPDKGGKKESAKATISFPIAKPAANPPKDQSQSSATASDPSKKPAQS